MLRKAKKCVSPHMLFCKGVNFSDSLEYSGSVISNDKAIRIKQFSRVLTRLVKLSGLSTHLFDLLPLSRFGPNYGFSLIRSLCSCLWRRSLGVHFSIKKALEKIHLVCLRRISGVGLDWQRDDHLSNTDLRSRLGVPSIDQLVRQTRVRWLGHVARMPNHRLPNNCYLLVYLMMLVRPDPRDYRKISSSEVPLLMIWHWLKWIEVAGSNGVMRLVVRSGGVRLSVDVRPAFS